MSGTNEQSSHPIGLARLSSTADTAVVPTLDELLNSDPDHFVAKYTDIAAVNLACARGLPNCDENEFPKYMALLDTIAEAVRRQTEKNYRLFKLKPQQFNHSEAVFRLYTMEHVFRVQFGIRYDPVVRKAVGDRTGARDIAKAWNTCDSTEVFIHGLLSKKRTGTCSSLPTFAIAVGRRLGYPLKLILVPNHTLYRWDDGKEILNLQPTEAGGDIRPNEYFYEWPRKWDEYDYQMNARTKVWLHSLTPKKEASKFLCNRALMLRECKRHDEALQTLAAACRFDPINPACLDIELSIKHVMNGGEPADHYRREEAAFAEEHYRLVNLINQTNRNKSPHHPNGNPPVEPLLRQLTKLLQSRKRKSW